MRDCILQFLIFLYVETIGIFLYSFYMFNLFKDFILIFKKGNQDSDNQHSTIGRIYNLSNSKNVITSNDSLVINSKEKQKIEQVKKNVSDILISNKDITPDVLLNYVKASNTPVYMIKNADKYMNLIKEETGFIPAKKGVEALYISLIVGTGFRFSTPEMFFLSNDNLEMLFVLHHFYKWCSFKIGLDGFADKTQKMLKIVLYSNKSDKYIKKLKMPQVIELRAAVARDREATDFVLAYAQNTEGSKKVMEKFKTENSANI